jgi:outer membrane protein assembly factor BamB
MAIFSRRLGKCLAGASLLVLWPALASAQVDVVQDHVDAARTGANLAETRLTPQVVGAPGFGKQFSQAVDGEIYAQPLIIRQVRVAGKGTHNIVLVATQNDSVYAFDADGATGSNASPLWRASLTSASHGATPDARPVRVDDFGTDAQGHICNNIEPTVGITSTPVVDKARQVVYVVAKSVQAGQTVQKLHALDLRSGLELTGSPVMIAPPNTQGAQFDPLWNLNRAGLVLANQRVYVTFASHCDGFEVHRYHGWVLSYDALTLQPSAVRPISQGAAAQEGGAIWASGVGPAVDAAGQIYLTTGDGSYDGQSNFGDSVLKLDGKTLQVLDHFAPSDQARLNELDLDLGSSGPVLLPDQPGAHPHLLAQSGKDGRVYLIDRDRLGGYCETCQDRHAVQALPSGTVGAPGLFGAPAFWNQRLYFWGNGDVLKVFDLSNGQLKASPQLGTFKQAFPGSTPAVSARGKAQGIVWTVAPKLGSPGVLMAFDALTLAPLFSSATRPEDALGPTVRFVSPVVANGRVYVGSSDRLTVYAARVKWMGRWVTLY